VGVLGKRGNQGPRKGGKTKRIGKRARDEVVRTKVSKSRKGKTYKKAEKNETEKNLFGSNLGPHW